MFDASGGGATHFIALVEHPTIGVLEEGEIEARWPGCERLATFRLTGDYVYGLWSAKSLTPPPASPPR